MLIAFFSGLAALLGVLLVRMGVLEPRKSSLDERLARLTENNAGKTTTLSDIELSAPLFERLTSPVLDRLGKLVTRGTSAGSLGSIQENLNEAGKPYDLTVGGFLLLKLLNIVVLTLVAYLLGGILLASSGAVLLLLMMGGAVLGYILPNFWLRKKRNQRRKLLLKSLPDALDLLTISVEAGLGFDAALVKVCDKYKNPLTTEFAQVIYEVRLGRPRLEALDDMGKRTGVEDVNSFVQAVIQSEALGVGITQVLRIQAEEVRRRKRQRAEELAQKAPLKMLFPMIGCIFPILFIILLGPALITVIHQFGVPH